MSNVISFASGMPIEEENLLLEEILLDEQVRRETMMAHDTESMRTRLKVANGLIDEGRLTGMMLFGTDPITGLFYTDIDVSLLPREELFGYMGLLQTVITELQEHAAMAPTIGSTGEIIDPYAEPAS